jgi:type IV pilus assembly protein PilY1
MKGYRGSSRRIVAALILFVCTRTLALGAPVDIASTPLGTATSGVQVQPNIMLILDNSGSMERDYVPDTVNPTRPDVFLARTNQTANTCRPDSNGETLCRAGDPPYNAVQFNGLAYNPQARYRPAVNPAGNPLATFVAPWASIPQDAFSPKSARVNLPSGFTEIGYTNGGTSVRRNGVHNGARFAYATPPKAPIANVIFTRAGNTVTGSTGNAAHGIQRGDVIDVTGAGGCSATAATVTEVPTPSSFRFVYGDAQTQPTTCGIGAVSFSVVGYPESRGTSFATTAVVVSSGRTVQVTFPNHGLIPGDLINVTGAAACAAAKVTVLAPGITTDTFTYTRSSSTGACSGSFTISRPPATARKQISTAPYQYTIVPTEYCADLHLMDCIGANAPAGRYTIPAQVRYCSSLAAAQQPPNPTPGPLVGDAPCVDKYLPRISGRPGLEYVFPRYGLFVRENIVPDVKTYARSGRGDCAGTVCTYDQEMTNFANWFAFYQTRIQAMKSAVGLAFQPVDANYRVGFTQIDPAGSLQSAVASTCATNASFLKVDTFAGPQKDVFYCVLYNQIASGGTPARQALGRVGRYYAHKTDGVNSGIDPADDPIQYSCQRNYAILTTDGQWKPTTGAPAIPAGTMVGNMDGNAGLAAKLVSVESGTYDGGCADGNVDASRGQEGCANTLSDVALYYYANDLRDPAWGNAANSQGLDVSENNVTTNPRDGANWQHMVTYGVGLADGVMTWQPDYDTAATGDFHAITNRSQGCFWSGVGDCKWPVPASETPTAVDDLWHAAVNGHGRYFHASDPQSLVNGLSGSLAAIAAQSGSGAGAGVSSPVVTNGDNLAFTSKYDAADWSGSFERHDIDLSTGTIAETATWEAGAILDGRDAASRNIFTFAPPGSSSTPNPTNTRPFLFASLSAAEQAWLSNLCVAPMRLSQCPGLSVDDTATANSGAKVVEFLRGSNASPRAFRPRPHKLGDIVDSSALVVGVPRLNFPDKAYVQFKADMAKRRRVVYVGANDGMLHAFDTESGAELWAYVPRMLIPKMAQLADAAYPGRHTNFVDATPTAMDVWDGAAWHTILAGGLNAGGNGFYVLDVTTPDTPTVLWELCSDAALCAFSDPDLGLSFGQPIITNVNNRAVILVTSGYNNASGAQFLYVIDLFTHTVIQKVPTGNSTSLPGGLARIAAWADNFVGNNTAQYVYGGDLSGNLWRFDLTVQPATVTLLATLKDDAGNPQPVTTRPELGLIKGNRVVFVGTGRLLGMSDLADVSQQSFYAIKDVGAIPGNVRANMVRRTLQDHGDTRTVTAGDALDWTAVNGWFIDFNPASTSPGERMNIDPLLTLGTLTFVTNVPKAEACKPGGSAWLYDFDSTTGSFVTTVTTGVVGQKIEGGLVTGMVIVSLPGGQKVVEIAKTKSSPETRNVPLPGGPGRGRRVGWREITR